MTSTGLEDEFAALVPFIFGFEASGTAGFELVGMGGGAPLPGVESGRVAGADGASLVVLFMPHDSADGLARGGGSGSARDGGGGGSLLAG